MAAEILVTLKANNVTVQEIETLEATLNKMADEPLHREDDIVEALTAMCEELRQGNDVTLLKVVS